MESWSRILSLFELCTFHPASLDPVYEVSENNISNIPEEIDAYNGP